MFFFNVFKNSKLKAICNDITHLKDSIRTIYRGLGDLHEIVRTNDHFHIDNINNMHKRIAKLELDGEIKRQSVKDSIFSQYQEQNTRLNDRIHDLQQSESILREQLVADQKQLLKEKSAYQEVQKLIREYGKTIFELSEANKELGKVNNTIEEVNLALEGRDKVQRSIIETLHYQVSYLVTSMKLMAVAIESNPTGPNTVAVSMGMAKLASDYIEQNDPLVDRRVSR